MHDVVIIENYWLRGYGDPPPRTVIAIGMGGTAYGLFDGCQTAGVVTNRFAVVNQEVRERNIYLCGPPRAPWSRLWESLQAFE